MIISCSYYNSIKSGGLKSISRYKNWQEKIETYKNARLLSLNIIATQNSRKNHQNEKHFSLPIIEVNFVDFNLI